MAARRSAGVVDWPSRWRLRRFSRNRRSSSRHRRGIFLRLRTWPSRSSTACARRYPQRARALAKARSRARKLTIRVIGLGGRMALGGAVLSDDLTGRRCDRLRRSWSISTARRRLDGLTSFPGSFPGAHRSPAPLSARMRLSRVFVLPLQLLEAAGVVGLHAAETGSASVGRWPPTPRGIGPRLRPPLLPREGDRPRGACG